MATVGETLFIALGLDASSAVEGLKQFQNNLQSTSDTAVNSAQKLENDTQNALQNVDNSAKNINSTLQQAEEQTKNTGSSFENMTAKWGGALKGLFTSILAPIAGAMTAGAVLKGYFSDVSQVAEMTGAYSSKMEEWRKKRNMLARVNREDIELYKKIREGMFKFNEAMSNVSAVIMRSVSPAIKFMVDLLDKFSNWLNANQNNILRFIKILAVAISTALIPSLIRMGKALLMNPLTWIIATLGILILIVDDLITYIHGGDSALGGLWSQFGTGEEIGKALNSMLQNLMTILSIIGKPLAVLAGGFAVFKIVKTAISGVVTGIHAMRTALTALTAHPIIAFLTAIIALIMWVADAFNRAGGDWSKVLDIMGQDVIDFLNLFGGLGDKLKDGFVSLFAFISNIFNTFKDYFLNVFNILTDSNLSFFEKVTGIFNAFVELVSNIAKIIIDRFKEIFDTIVGIFAKIFEPIDNALNGALSNTWNKIKEGFVSLFEFISNIFNSFKDYFLNVFNILTDSHLSFFEKVSGIFNAFIELVSNIAKIIIDRFKEIFDTIVGIFAKIFEPIDNALNGALSNVWNKIKDTFTAIKDYIISVFKDAFDFFGNGISKVKSALTSATDGVKSFFDFSSDDEKNLKERANNEKNLKERANNEKDLKEGANNEKDLKERANNEKDLADVATASNVANNNYKNDVNKSVVQNINVDARNSEAKAGEFVASLTQDTNDYNNYSNNAQTAQF